MPRDAHILLLTGTPGVGKTTLVCKVAASLAERKVAGFYTEEIRSRGGREGFRLVTFDGQEKVMSHTRFPKTHRVGRYGVDIAAIDAVVKGSLGVDAAVDVYIVDEVGKMECFSERFVAALRQLLDSGRPVVATIARRGTGFIAEVKQRKDTELWEVTRSNRDELREKVIKWLVGRCRFS